MTWHETDRNRRHVIHVVDDMKEQRTLHELIKQASKLMKWPNSPNHMLTLLKGKKT